jgi:hypothetical protein
MPTGGANRKGEAWLLDTAVPCFLSLSLSFFALPMFNIRFTRGLSSGLIVMVK